MNTAEIKQYPDGRMDAQNACKYLGISYGSLARMRCEGTGPRFTKIGKVFYFQADLDAWIADRGGFVSSAQARIKMAT